MSPDKRSEKPDAKRSDEGAGDDDAGVGGAGADPRGGDRDHGERSAAASGGDRAGRRKLRAAVERVDESGSKRGSHGRAARKAKAEGAGGSGPKRARPRREDGEARKGRTSRRRRQRLRKRGSRRRREAASPKALAGRTLRAVRTGAVRLIAGLLGILAGAAALLFAVLGRGLAFVLLVWVRALPPARALANRWRRALNAAARAVTPKRVMALVVAGAAVLLALSQFADYRSVSIGTDAYSGLEAIAPPPEVGREEAGDPSSYVLVPLGLACLPLLLLALRGRRWAGRAIAIVGAAAILVALLVDRPAGLDVSEVAVSFEGVEAKLLGGFYAQIAAGVVLLVSSLILSRVVLERIPERTRGTGRVGRAHGEVREANA